MTYAQSLILAFIVVTQAISTVALAGEHPSLRGVFDAAGAQKDARVAKLTRDDPLDRVATAVDGAESSHGKDAAMWRPDLSGPQGPMQVGEAAATDVGGGDRFDLAQNRAIGRAYLAQLYGRYGNWPDAIAAYNWGLGKMDAWVRAGRPPDKFLVGVAIYLRRVMRESGLCEVFETSRTRQPSESRGSARQSAAIAGNRHPSPEAALELVMMPADPATNTACSTTEAWAGAGRFGGGSGSFTKKLDKALQLALQRALQGS
jgi:Transglycosylase SLT domain